MALRKIATLVALVFVLLLLTTETHATNVCGWISTNTTWSPGGNPYVATCNVTILPGVTLTIQPGVTVQFNSGISLLVEGNLQAIGASGSPITFTSSGTPARGSWGGIEFLTANSGSQLSYVNVLWGGGANNGLIVVHAAPGPTIDHSTLSESSTNGIWHLSGWYTNITDSTISNCSQRGAYISAGGINFTDTTISNNGGYGIWVDVWSTANLNNITLTNNSDYAIGATRNAAIAITPPAVVTGNGGGLKNAIGHQGNLINFGVTWDSEIPIVLLSSVTIDPSGSLTINAGATIKCNSGIRITAQGRLTAIGTASQPITFTSSATTPARGNWEGIRFEPGSATASQLSYVTAMWGGASLGGLISVETNPNPPPTIDHLTLSESSTSGIIHLSGWSTNITDATISNCTNRGANILGGGINFTNTTISNNGSYGIWVDVWSTANLNNITLTNNTDYAIGATRNAAIPITPPAVVTGNGGGAKNFIAHQGGLINFGVTWDSEIPTILLNGITVDPIGLLTINAGSLIKFGADTSIDVYGRILAIGTDQQPITFTSNQLVPAPGNWGGIYIHTASLASELKYATISYAGDAQSSGFNGAVVLDGSSPLIDHVTISSASSSGIIVLPYGSPNPTITHCSFQNNLGGGILNQHATTITAKLNYWNSTNGPSGSGPGNGDSISTKVLFDPFFAATPLSPHWFTSTTVLNQTFNPANGVNISIPFVTTLSGNWTANFKNAAGTILRTFNGTGLSSTVVWDGRDTSGTLMFDGTYNFEILSTAISGEIAASVKGFAIVIDSTKQLAISSFTVGSLFFSPNNDGVQEITTVQATFNFDDVNWTLNFRNSANDIVRSTTGLGPSFSFTWDGKNAGGTVQADGAYVVELLVADGTMSSGANLSTTLDNTAPVSQILSPDGTGILSNVYQAGSTLVTVTANTTDLNHQNWLLELGAGSAPVSWSTVTSGTNQSSGNTISSWYTDSVTNGVYSLKLQTWDKAGNRTTHSTTFTIGNFSASMNVQQINAAAGETVQITSVIPFSLTETLVLKNQAGTVIRTLVNGVSRNAGNYQDAWNGRLENGSYLPAGPYFYVVTVSDGTNTMTWDLTGHPIGHYCNTASLSAWDPFNNQPAVITYSHGGPSVYTIAYSPFWTYHPLGPGLMLPGCASPNHCVVQDEFRESGTHTFRWAGVDAAGAFRGDMVGFVVWHNQVMEQNVVVVYGTRLNVTAIVTATPPIFNPQITTQSISLNVASFQNQVVNVNARFQNQASLSYLRTINLNGVNPGALNIVWDGKADNGMWVAPGFYTIWLEITDGIGNIAKEQVLVTVRY